MFHFRMSWLFFLIAAVFVAAPVRVLAESEPKQKSASFKVSAADETIVGLYEFKHVVREEGVFASSVFYKGEKILTVTKPGTPAVRSYLELTPGRTWEKYTRWVTRGINTSSFKLFRYRRDIKLRKTGIGKAKVSVVGKFKPVYLIEAEQPYTAALLVDRKVPEKKLACINSTLGKIGEAVIRMVGVSSVPAAPLVLKNDAAGASDNAAGDVEAKAEARTTTESAAPVEPAASKLDSEPAVKPDVVSKQKFVDIYKFQIDGDCGTFSVWQDGDGNFVRFSNEKYVYTPFEK